jgi:hypothetical protein
MGEGEAPPAESVLLGLLADELDADEASLAAALLLEELPDDEPHAAVVSARLTAATENRIPRIFTILSPHFVGRG